MLDEPVNTPGTTQFWRKVEFRIVKELPPHETTIETKSGMRVKMTEPRHDLPFVAATNLAAAAWASKWPADGWIRRAEPPIDNDISIDNFKTACEMHGLIDPHCEVWEDPGRCFNVGIKGFPRAGDVRVSFAMTPGGTSAQLTYNGGKSDPTRKQRPGLAWIGAISLLSLVCLFVWFLLFRASRR